MAALVFDIATRLAEYRRQLDAAGLGRYADSLSETAYPSVRLVADSQIDAAAVGASRLGGVPDLPADLPWPVNDDGAPLSFMATFLVCSVEFPQVIAPFQPTRRRNLGLAVMGAS